MDQRVELALGQHVLDRLVVRQPRDLEVGRRREIDVLVELGEPFDRFVRHAVFVLEDAAHPVDRGDQERLDADLLADQVGRLLDALGGVDEDEAVAEAAVQEHRDGGDRHALVARHDVGRAGGLGDVEMAPSRRKRQCRVVESMSVRMVRSMPSGATDAVLERAHDLVVAAGQRQGDVFWHFFASLRSAAVPGAVKLHLAAKSSLRLKPYRGLWIS